MQALKRNYFEFFSLKPGFAIDLAGLSESYRRVQGSVHPDRFANAGPAEKRYAMQLATMANEAHVTLKNPLSRARYLCEMNGVEIGAEDNTAMPAEFMIQQMEWREALEDAGHGPDIPAIDALAADVATVRDQLELDLTQRIDAEADFASAADLVRRWMFLDRFETEIRTVRSRPGDGN